MNLSESGKTVDRFMRFNWIDYCTFGSLLGISALIGIYYGFIKGNQNTVSEYMLGGKKMNTFPIAMSLIASHVSGVTLLGVPAEVYEHGTQYITTIFSTILVVYMTNKFYLPVFYDLQLNSVYEYLELRFSSGVRKLASFTFLCSVILSIPLVMYIPALAFNEVTGVSVHIIAPIVGILCIFYTTIGGLKTVVWTDSIQSMFTFLSVTAVIILGVINVGGIYKIFEISEKGGRLEIFNMNPDPTARNTFWTVTVGTFFLWMTAVAIHPGSIQRFIALPNMNAAKWSVIIFGVGMVVVKSLAVFVGLIIYTKYSLCDPKRSKAITRTGQLLPYYVQEVAVGFPGLTGIFLSGLISAALSTMSAGLNTVAGTLYEDFIIIWMPAETTDAQASTIMKFIVVILGTTCVFLVHVVEKFEAILQMAISLHGVTNGAIFAVFALGIFFPWTNTKGALAGVFASLIIMVWIISGAQLAIYNKTLQFLGKPTSIINCAQNETIIDAEHDIGQNMKEVSTGVYADDSVFPIYRLSYMYYTTIGSIIGILVAIIVSYFTDGEDLEELNPELVTPIMRRFLQKKTKYNKNISDEVNRLEYKQVIMEMENQNNYETRK